MSSESKAIGGFVVFFILVVAACLGWSWYKAGVQREVYRRQGVEMTQWEVFCGSVPAERALIPANR